MSNLAIYEATRSVPAAALREIKAGRIKGKSDINPMWRLKSLTEQFGPCGIGWKYTIDKQWIEKGDGVEQAAFVNISLFIKLNGEWSAAIPGTGGSSFVTQESKGVYTSDECYKMALTDAISVACKALGFGADVYWSADKTKYTGNNQHGSQEQPQQGKVDQTPSQKAYGQLIDWIDKAIQNRAKIPDQTAFKEWFNNDENATLVEAKSCLTAQELAAVNRHFEQTMKLLPPRQMNNAS